MIVHLHAGTHKTGTTAIQVFLSRQRALLAERGLYVPEAGLTDGGHHNIAYELGGHMVDPHAGGLERLVEELRERAPELACLSSENFYPLSSKPGALERLRDALAGIGAEVRPLLFFRPQAMLLEALYSEFVKHGMREPFDVVFDEALDRGSLSYNEAIYDLEYDRVAATFARVFGRGATTVLAYSGAGGAEQIIATFLSVVLAGCEDLNLTRLGAWERFNLSIGFRSVASTLAANRGDEGGAFEDVLDEMMRDKVEPIDVLLRPHGRYWDGKFEPLSVDDLARLYSRFGDGNRMLRATYGADVPVCKPSRLFDEVRSRR